MKIINSLDGMYYILRYNHAFYPTNHKPCENGVRKCKTCHLANTHCLRLQNDILDTLILSRLWPKSGWRCKIWYDRIHFIYVDLSSCSYHLFSSYFSYGPLAVWIGMGADWTIRSFIFLARFKSNK